MSRRSRDWFVTINNFCDDDVEMAKKSGAVWGAIGWHVGEKSGISHVHIALRFNTAKRMSALSRLFPRGHCEVMRGSAEEALGYLDK